MLTLNNVIDYCKLQVPDNTRISIFCQLSPFSCLFYRNVQMIFFLDVTMETSSNESTKKQKDTWCQTEHIIL
jgi:hypothetical protein